MTLNNEYIKQRKVAIIIAMFVIILGTTLYFGTGIYKKGLMTPLTNIDENTLELLRNIQLKAAYNDEGMIKIFAITNSPYLSLLNTSYGQSILNKGEIVIGNIEASMMVDNGISINQGDIIEDFGSKFIVKGVLSKTGTFVDDFHFIDISEYNSLTGESDKLFIEFKDEKTPKLFYLYDKNNPAPIAIRLSEGDMSSYREQIINGKTYYPVILGYDEAKMMREEKLFTNIGDTLDGFFGKDVVFVGIIEKTNTNMDMMHIVEPNFFEKNVEGVLV